MAYKVVRKKFNAAYETTRKEFFPRCYEMIKTITSFTTHNLSLAVKAEPTEESNPEAEAAAQETESAEVKEEAKEEQKEDAEAEEKPESAEVDEKDKSLTDPSLEEQKPVMAAPPAVAADIKFNITTKVGNIIFSLAGKPRKFISLKCV